MYISDAHLSTVVLEILNKCLHRTLTETPPQESTSKQQPEQKETKDDETHGPSKNSLERAKKLHRFVEEGIERLNVIEASKKHFRIGSHRLENISFMSKMLSNPESLLNIYLKRKDYVLCKRIIQYFHLPTPRYTEVAVAEKLDEISSDIINSARITKNNNSKSRRNVIEDFGFVNELIAIREHGSQGVSSPEESHAVVSTSANATSLDPQLHAFYMIVDLAVSIAPTAARSKRLLSKSQDVLDSWLESKGGSSQTSNGNGAATLAKGLHAYFTNIVIRRYVKLIETKSEMAEEVGDELPPLWTLLKQVENMPMEPTILESHLSQIRSRDHVLDALKNVFGGDDETGGAQNIEHLIQSFIQQYSEQRTSADDFKDDVEPGGKRKEGQGPPESVGG